LSIGASGAGRWARNLPWPAILLGFALFALLMAFVSADPARNVTFSSSPFSDEGFTVANSRNLIQLGRWDTDQWHLYLVNLPYSLLAAGSFALFGVGIESARLVSITCVSITAAALAWGLRRPLGTTWALFAGIAFATSGLVLYYGRLTFNEDLVVLGVTLGALVLGSGERLSFRWGLVAGACFAIAIGTKPSAGFSIAGILVALGAVWGWRREDVRRWLAGAVVSIGFFGLAWLLVVWLPNRDAVAMDIRIWAPVHLSLTPLGMLRSLSSYLRGNSDGVIGLLLGPLIALAGAGVVGIAALRKRLDPDQARLAVVGLGWVAAGFWVVIVASYRPNRYVMPVIPGLAILAAVGLAQIAGWVSDRLALTPAASPPEGKAATSGHVKPDAGRRKSRALTPAFACLAIAMAAAPGLGLFYSWNRQATYELPQIQDRMAALVPPGTRVAGRESGLFLAKSKALTLEVQLTQTDTAANAGDLYSDGVRWYLQPTTAPIPPGVPASVWAQRQNVDCAPWGGLTECLIKLP
jgi:hypothetical protein